MVDGDDFPNPHFAKLETVTSKPPGHIRQTKKSLDKNIMDWETYEEVTKKIYEALGKDKGVTIECWGRQCKVKGNSDVNHQVDVLTNYTDGIHNYKTAIECKYWNQTVDKDVIMKVQAIVNDAKLNKGVIVSKFGFTPDTIKYAQQYGIGLVELREITDTDWEGRIKKVILNFETFLPNIERMNFITDRDGELGPVNGDVVATFEITSPDGTKTNVWDLAGAFHSELLTRKENENYTRVFNFPEGSLAKDTTGQLDIPVTGVQFFGSLRIARQTHEINAQNHVWLIMKSIFEDKTFTISKAGVIDELQN